MKSIHYEYGVGHEISELFYPVSAVGMDKNILDLIHIVSFVYGSGDILYECLITHPKALKMHGVYRFVPLFVGNIHALRYGDKRHERALFRTQMNVILIGEYVELRGSIFDPFDFRHRLFHG